MLAASLQLLLPGMPMIYYGDEVGLEGGPDPDCRRGMLWEETRQNQSLLQYYQTLLRIRHGYPALTEGTVLEQYTDDDKGIFYCKRRLKDQQITVISTRKQGNKRCRGSRAGKILWTVSRFAEYLEIMRR